MAAARSESVWPNTGRTVRAGHAPMIPRIAVLLVLISGLPVGLAPCDAQRVWHEAEDIPGNSSTVPDYEGAVSAAAYVSGGQWYRLVHIPVAADAAHDHVWVRMRASGEMTVAMLDDEDQPLGVRLLSRPL